VFVLPPRTRDGRTNKLSVEAAHLNAPSQELVAATSAHPASRATGLPGPTGAHPLRVTWAETAFHSPTVRTQTSV
jgi:hypothetical protein